MEEQEAMPSTTPKTLGPIAQRKHAALLERLSKKSHTNSRQADSDGDDSSSLSSGFESTQSFLSLFSKSQLSIESELSRIQQSPVDNTDSNAQLLVKSHLQSISLSISQLEKMVADNSYFLPPYEVRSALNTISDLKQTLDSVTSLVVPRKRFAFKNKATKNDKTTTSNYDDAVGELPQIASDPHDDKSERIGFGVVWDGPGFKNKENEILVKQFKKNGGSEEEFTVSDLRDCELRLMGCLRALFVNKLRNCRVYVGPVLGSILIEEVEGCVFVLASHQIRIHRAIGCDFYLRVRSRPIIEDSSGVRFAPYCLRYDGIEGDLEEANLGDAENENWSNVDDFRWLRAVQSPNWSILPESERIATVYTC